MTKNSNWTQYNESFVNRGNVTFQSSDDVLELQNSKNQGCRRGRPFVYNYTIRRSKRCCSFAKSSSTLPIETPKGLDETMFSLLKVQEACVPGYTSFYKRSKRLNVSLKVYGKGAPLDVVGDSTKMKVQGKGGWKVYKHGRGKRLT